MPFFMACANDGVANAMMTILRAMETWAIDQMLTMDDVTVKSWEWYGGELVVEFE